MNWYKIRKYRCLIPLHIVAHATSDDRRHGSSILMLDLQLLYHRMTFVSKISASLFNSVWAWTLSRRMYGKSFVCLRRTMWPMRKVKARGLHKEITSSVSRQNQKLMFRSKSKTHWRLLGSLALLFCQIFSAMKIAIRILKRNNLDK